MSNEPITLAQVKAAAREKGLQVNSPVGTESGAILLNKAREKEFAAGFWWGKGCGGMTNQEALRAALHLIKGWPFGGKTNVCDEEKMKP